MTADREMLLELADLAPAQLACLLGIAPTFSPGERFRPNEGESHSPYINLVRLGVLGRERFGDIGNVYWLTEAGHGLRANSTLMRGDEK